MVGVSYRLLGHDPLGGWGVWAGGLLVDLARSSVPGGWSRSGVVLLRGREEGSDLVEHSEG